MAAFLAGLTMTTVGLLGFLALTVVLVWGLVGYSQQQVRLAISRSSDPIFDRQPRPAAPSAPAKIRRVA